jgi:(p)ppGpp synthase/HD superfamily hydrolase
MRSGSSTGKDGGVDVNLEDQAALLALSAHQGQVDKQGHDYFGAHLLPIAEMLRPFGSNAYMAGILHDVVEDTSLTLAELAGQGFPAIVVDAVDAVTRREGETYPDLIERAGAHPLGRLVKLADNWHNLSSLDELAGTDPDTAARLRQKYLTARLALTAALETGEAAGNV